MQNARVFPTLIFSRHWSAWSSVSHGSGNPTSPPFLTLHPCNGYARLRMRATLRRVIIALLVLAALAGIAYQSRHKLHLADFTWKKFIGSVSDANVWLLLVALVAIYGCYAIRSLRWQRFCRYIGPTTFINTYSGTLMGFSSMLILGRPGD